jgi:membrane protein DedA with SNARE-associated domain
MTIEWALSHFGYAAVLIGTFFEGETVLVLAGFAVHRGYMSLSLVIVSGFAGTVIGDQFYFFLGRRRGVRVLSRHPDWNRRIIKFMRLMDRHQNAILVLFRFMYGLRTVAPFAIGLSRISARKFIIFNIISAALWTAIVTMLGYLFGQTVEFLINDVKKYELIIIAVLLLLAAAVYLSRRRRNRKRMH